MSSTQMTKYQQRELVIRQVLEEADKSNLNPFVENIINGVLDIDQMNSIGFCAIHLAVWLNDWENILKLLDKAACPVDLPSGSGQTPLIVAASQGNLKIIKLLLDRGADIEAKDNLGMTSILNAANSGQVAAFYCLAHRGAMSEVVDKNGCGTLHWAAYKNQVNMLRVLKLKGCKLDLIDFSGMNCLHRAALSNAINAIEYLMFVGVNYDEKDSKGRNAIQVAKDNNASAAVSVLVKLSQDQLKLFHYFSYVYLMFWVSVYVVYHEYIFLETIENFTVSILFNFTFLWLGPLYVYFLFRLCKCYNPAFIQAPGEQVQELVQEKFDKSLFDEIPDINDFCVTCSVKRPIRSKHCRFLDKCILDYDHFSLFLGKSIGRGNRKTYYLWVLFNFFALACFLYLNWRFLHDMTRETGYFSSYLAEIVVCFVDMPGAYKVVVFVAWLLAWYSFCYSFLLGFCVSQGLTVNETLNRHRYRYLFESFEDDGNKKMRFRNPFNKGCFQNFVTFFMS